MADAFEISLSHKEPGIVYIKTDILEDYFKNNSKEYISKIFGDNNSGLIVTFIYKDEDKEFEQENLEKSILEFKNQNFLQELMGSIKNYDNNKK